MSTPSHDAALERVQNLYLLQHTLLELLSQDLSDPRLRRELRAQIQEFLRLLRGADWRYMGGEDVLDSLRALPSEVEQKLKLR